MAGLLAVLVMSMVPAPVTAEERPSTLVLNSRPLHLGVEGKPEWDEFSGKVPAAHRWETRFNATSNQQPATLFIRQDGVRQDWAVEVNGKRVGKLFLMEADLIHGISLPAGALREGENVLAIIPPREIDDIWLHEIRLDSRRIRDALAEASLTINVTNIDSGKPMACRLTVVDERGTLVSMLAKANAAQPIAVRPGVIYTGSGKAQVHLPAGRYTVFATRGFEYSVATQHVELVSRSETTIDLPLQHQVATPGFVSCDTHVHTFTHSRHGDATIEERMLTLAGEGIELPIATDHNLHIDYAEAAGRMNTAADFTAVAGNEVTTPAGHFNIFPVAPGARVPDFRITHWPTLMKSLRDTEGVRAVILNHPRNVHQGFQPFAATNFNAVSGENKRGAEFSFDAMEVLNSSAQQTDYMLVYRDWFALWNYGYRVTGVGSSDGHDVSRYIVGQGRTYIQAPDETPGRIDVPTVCSNLIAGRALVSMGLLVQMTVNGRFGGGDLATRLADPVRVRIKVLGPSWVEATNVSLFANGIRIREQDLRPLNRSRQRALGEQATVDWELPRPAHDVHLVAIAIGPGVTAPYWAIPRPYQPVSPRWEGRVIGSTNPILLDADGNGDFTPARGYAKQLLAKHASEPANLVSALQGFDEAVAAQVASLINAPGGAQNGADFEQALRGAAAHVRKGFEAYTTAR